MPDTPVDHPTIQEAYNNGEINKAGYDLLTKQLDDLATPEGFELATMKRGYVGAFRPLVDPNSPEAHTEAAAQTIQLEQSLSRKIDDMRASGRDPRDLFDPSTPDYKSPFDLVRDFAPRAQGASLLQTPQSGPTEADGTNKGPQAPDSGPRPEAAAPPATPPTESGHPQADVLAPGELPAINVWPDSAAPPNQLPRTDASVEAPRPSPSGKQASATNHKGEKTSELEDIGFLKGGLKAGFMELGLDADGAGRLADIVATAASVHPVGRVAFAVDDLLTAIRKDDRVGMVEAILALMPGGRFIHIPHPSAPPDAPGGGGRGHLGNPKPEKAPTESPSNKTIDAIKPDLAPVTDASPKSEAIPRQELANATPKASNEPATPPETTAQKTRLGSLTELQVDKYSRLRLQLSDGYQAHDINQNAVYGDIIPYNDGLTIPLYGNAFSAPMTQHYIVHHSVERFWDTYRRQASALTRPTNAQYGEAHRLALIEAGLPEEVANIFAKHAAAERARYGLKETDLVPNVPGRLNQAKK